MKAKVSFRLEQTRANGIKSRDGKKINEMKSVQITACFSLSIWSHKIATFKWKTKINKSTSKKRRRSRKRSKKSETESKSDREIER